MGEGTCHDHTKRYNLTSMLANGASERGLHVAWPLEGGDVSPLLI